MSPHFQQLLDYIRQSLHLGANEQHIRKSLLDANWQLPHIDWGFSTIYGLQEVSTPSNHPKKYRLFVAMKDAALVVRQNAGLLAVTLVVCLIVVLLAALIGGLIIAFFGLGSFGGFGVSKGSFLGALITSFLVVNILYSLVAAAIATSINLAADSKRPFSGAALTSIFSETLRRTPRVAIANFLLGVIVLGPFFLLVCFSLLVLYGSQNTAFIGIATVLGTTGAAVWTLIALLRFTLIPYVALFEPSLPILKTPARSFHLLNKGGQWFIFKGALLLLVFLLIVSLLTDQSLREVNASDNIVANILIIIASSFAQLVLVMLYKNRKAVRG